MIYKKKELAFRNLMASATRVLEASGIETARLDASLLLAHVLDISREQVLLELGRELNPEEAGKFNQLIERRLKNEPVAYITGKKEFWSLDFLVTRDTLIPRPDSETLVEAALRRAENIANERAGPRKLTDIGILDIGTGTGCLLIALLKELPLAHGIGADISGPALLVAEHNAEKHGVSGRVQFVKSNWCESVEGTFDLILSNPPYIAEGDFIHLTKDITGYEPYSALVSGPDGMDSYRAISRELPGRLNAGGYALLEVGQGQARKVAGIVEESGLTIDEIRNDLAGIPRCVIAHKKN